MSDIAVQGAKATKGVDGALPAEALEKGALTGFEDGEWTFAGDGVHSPKDVCGRMLELEIAKNPELALFGEASGDQLSSLKKYLAQRNLQERNRHLSQNPEAPVPEGQVFTAAGGPSLKQMLAPFANNLDALREAVEGVGLGGDAQANRTVGNVRTGALGLPTDPRL